MASDYGNNFGFLRSDEAVRVAEGRFRVPAGSTWLLGIPVEPDDTVAAGPPPLTTSPVERNELRVLDADRGPVAGYTGLLLQELEWLTSIYGAPADIIDSFAMGVAKASNLAIITGGAGTKVWYRNTPAQTRADGRVIPLRTMFAAGPYVRGQVLGWDFANTQFALLGVGITAGWLQVTDYSTAADGSERLEAVLLG